MVLYDFKTLLATPGETMDEDAIRRAIVIEALYTESDLLTDGMLAVGQRTFRDELDVKFDFPSDLSAEYPVPAGRQPRKWEVTWTEFAMTLEMAETGFYVDDRAVLRGLENLQWTTSLKRAAEAFANKQSKNIVDAIAAGKVGTAAATAVWDTTTADNILKDITAGWGYIYNNARVNTHDMEKLVLLVPPLAMAGLKKLAAYESNLRMSIESIIKQEYGIVIAASRDLKTAKKGYLLVPGEDTVRHGVLATNKIPLIEEKRVEARGKDYFARKFFQTKVTPEVTGGTTNKRIYEITTITT